MGNKMEIQDTENKPTINKKEAEALFLKYMSLALNSRTNRKDWSLFATYYGRAEYYLYLMNKLNGTYAARTKMMVKGGKVKADQMHKYCAPAARAH
jgi:hypothetical protein